MSKILIPGPVHQDHLNYSPRKVIFTGLLITSLFFGGIVLWASLAPLEGAVHAMGELTFDTKRKTVQHLEGGIVKQILVREGDTVAAGQPLIILADDQVRPAVDMLEGQTLSETAAMARLEAEKSDLATISFPATITSRAKEPAVSRVIQTETKLFNAKREAYLSQVEVLKSQISEIRQEIQGEREQLAEKKKGIAALEEQLAANKSLLKDGYVTRTAVLDQERMVADKNAEREGLSTGIARDMQRMVEYDLRLSGLKSARIQEAVADMRQASTKLMELNDRIRPALNTLERSVIRAPINGRVVDLKVSTIGGVIGAREPLMDIVPTSGHLVLVGKIGVNDIHDVHVGLPARVTLTAFKSSTTPMIRATVTSISADRLMTRSAQMDMPYYEVRMELDPDSLKAAGNLQTQLYPGMMAQASITTRPRTAFNYFIGPLTERLGKAFHEK